MKSGSNILASFGINGSLRKREVSNPQPYTEYYLFNSAANLKAYSNNGLDFAYYGYNASNTRAYKLSFLNQNQWVNGQPEPLDLQLQSAMFYPNAYINFNQNGEYTKHYYNGSERIASRLGSSTQPTDATSNDRLEYRMMREEEKFRENIQELVSDGQPVDFQGTVELNSLQPVNVTSDIFYYHTNHLGSTAFVTDQNQNITQGFLYAPFGEITTEYNSTFGNDVLPKYSFNAKELDEETGMYYYEARYYAPPVFTSRDPLMSEKPWLTPYHYCSNNPVGRVDPSGMLDEENPYLIFNGKTNKLQIWDDGNTPDNYDDDRFLGEYDAHNNVTSDSKGKWEDGIYNMLDKNSAHKHGNLTDKNNVQLDSPNGSYGVDGCFRAEPFHETTTNETREGMAVHAGREHLSFLKRKTLGCVRTTPKAMKGIIKAIKEYGPLQKIIIQNNRTSLNSEKANSIAPHNARVLPLFDPSIIPIVLPDKVRVAHISF